MNKSQTDTWDEKGVKIIQFLENEDGAVNPVEMYHIVLGMFGALVNAANLSEKDINKLLNNLKATAIRARMKSEN